MSVATWKKEFYTRPSKKMSVKEAVDHSVKKWEGTLKKNLTKHKVKFDCHCVESDDPSKSEHQWFQFDVTTCALCALFYKKKPDTWNSGTCGACPVNKGGPNHFGCGEGSVFEASIDGDSSAMLAVLRRIQRRMEKNAVYNHLHI